MIPETNEVGLMCFPVHSLERISRPQHRERTELESTRLFELVENSGGIVKPSQIEITGWKTGEEGEEQKKNPGDLQRVFS